MNEDIENNDENEQKKICPCCDHEIEVDENIDKKVVCWYCYYRSHVGVLKFQIFKVMKDEGNPYMTKEEITKHVNKFRKKHGKPEIKVKTVYDVLLRYSRYYENAKKRRRGYLLLVHVKKPKKGGKGGRPRKYYKLSDRLSKRVIRMQKRWESGLPINSKVNKGKKFKMTIDYNRRSRSISNKIKRKDYPIYKYMIRNSY